MNETGSLFLSLNFESGELPARIKLVPSGALVVGRDGRTWKNPDAKKVALNSNTRLPMLPIDENHSTDLAAPKGGASPAFGWMRNLCADEEGAIWADVEWTEKGREGISKKEYRFLSPVFMSNEKGEINCILRAALTNTPNLQLPALNSQLPEKINLTEDFMTKELCTALGIAETATVNDALAAIEKLKTAQNAAQTVDLAAYAPRAELNAALEKAVSTEKQLAELNAAQMKKDAEAAVDGAVKAGKIPPALKDTYVALCSTKEGMATFADIVAKTPAIVDGKAQAPETPPPAAGGVSLNSEDAAIAKAMGYSVTEYQKMKEAGI